MLSNSLEDIILSFVEIDADKGDQTDHDHQSCSAETDDIFQILRAIFFETHFLCLLIKTFFCRDIFFDREGDCMQCFFYFL